VGERARALIWQRIDREESAARADLWRKLLRRDFGMDVRYDRVLYEQWLPEFERAVSTQHTFIKSLR
jgi:hypothetical protein